MQPMRMQPMRRKPWIALWSIKDIPDDGFEVIRDGRHVGLTRCDTFDEAVKQILRHRLYHNRDRIVCRDGRREWNVDLDDHLPEPVGA